MTHHQPARPGRPPWLVAAVLALVLLAGAASSILFLYATGMIGHRDRGADVGTFVDPARPPAPRPSAGLPSSP